MGVLDSGKFECAWRSYHVVELAEPGRERGAIFDLAWPESGVRELQLEVLPAQLARVVLAQRRYQVAHRALVVRRGLEKREEQAAKG